MILFSDAFPVTDILSAQDLLHLWFTYVITPSYSLPGTCSVSTWIRGQFLKSEHLLAMSPTGLPPCSESVEFSCLNRGFGFTFLRLRPQRSSFHSLPLPTKRF